MQVLHKEHAAQGLHIFTFEHQGSTPDQIRQLIASKGGADYAVSAGGCNEYRGNGGIPVAWVIGVDGNVVFAGNPGSSAYENAIKAELLKVKYPGLGKYGISSSVDRAAKLFVKGDLADARNEASKIAADDKETETAKADAQFVIDRVTTRGKSRIERARQLEGQKRYTEASKEWQWVATAFGTSEEGAAAKARLDEYKKDKAIKDEMKAEEALEALRVAIGKMKAGNAPLPARMKKVEDFARKYEGTGAAERATTELAELLK